MAKKIRYALINSPILTGGACACNGYKIDLTRVFGGIGTAKCQLPIQNVGSLTVTTSFYRKKRKVRKLTKYVFQK